MIVKRKLYSVMDEEGNQGYYLYNEATGEEKLFSVVEDEKMYARGTKEAGKAAMEFLSKKGNKVANKEAKFRHTRFNLSELSNPAEFDVARGLIKVGEKLNQAKSKGDLKTADKIMNRFNNGLVIPVIKGRVAAKNKEGLDILDDAFYVKKYYTPKDFAHWKKSNHKYFIKSFRNR